MWKLFGFAFLLILSSIQVFGADLSLKWGEQAFKLCKKREKELPNFKGFCGRFEDIVQDVFDEQGLKLQTAFGTRYSSAEAIADKEPFKSAGVSMLNGYFDWIVKHKVTDPKLIKGEFVQRFFKWFAEVIKEVDKPGVGYMGVQNIEYNDPIELGIQRNEKVNKKKQEL